jgi:hypothetical protein
LAEPVPESLRRGPAARLLGPVSVAIALAVAFVAGAALAGTVSIWLVMAASAAFALSGSA